MSNSWDSPATLSPDTSFRTHDSHDVVHRCRAYSCDSPGVRVRAGFYSYLHSPQRDKNGDLASERRPPTQGSLVTIFSLWTSMVGASILTIPWAISQAGLSLGIGLIFLIGLFAFYPVCIIIQSSKDVAIHIGSPVKTFFEVCNYALGPYVAWFSVAISLLNLLGDLICYWILLSSLLFEIGCFFHDAEDLVKPNMTAALMNGTHTAVHVAPLSFQYEYWNEVVSVPLYLVLLLLPFTCLRNPVFFTKFSSLGIVSIVFLVTFVVFKSVMEGAHVGALTGFSDYNSHFPALTGTLSIGFLVHNIVISMTSYHEHPKDKFRDTGIAFFLTAATYALLAGFYISYPGPKDEISDNFLKNFAVNDLLAFFARLLLFFQILTVFPLLAFLFRVQLFSACKDWVKLVNVGIHIIVLLNCVLIGTCLIFACFYPKVGHLLRYIGAICGLVYIGLLPFMVQIALAYKEGKPVILKILVFIVFLTLGVANFVGQILLSHY